MGKPIFVRLPGWAPHQRLAGSGMQSPLPARLLQQNVLRRLLPAAYQHPPIWTTRVSSIFFVRAIAVSLAVASTQKLSASPLSTENE